MLAFPDLEFQSTRTLTQEEFAQWMLERPSSDDNRYELLDGRVVMSPPAGYPHGFIEGRLAGRLEPIVRERKLGVHFSSSQGFELPSNDTVAPDQSFVSAARWKAMTDPPKPAKFLRVVPDLVIEILSPATASTDRSTKHRIYERNGVREYWLVDPRREQIVVFVRRGDRFDDGRTFTGATTASSEVVAGFAIDVAALFAPPSFD